MARNNVGTKVIHNQNLVKCCKESVMVDFMLKKKQQHGRDDIITTVIFLPKIRLSGTSVWSTPMSMQSMKRLTLLCGWESLENTNNILVPSFLCSSRVGKTCWYTRPSWSVNCTITLQYK